MDDLDLEEGREREELAGQNSARRGGAPLMAVRSSLASAKRALESMIRCGKAWGGSGDQGKLT